MRAVMKTHAGPGLELKMVDIPRIQPGHALVKVDAASICGTDVHIFKWDQWSAGRITPPIIIGHEFSGHVVEVADDVTRVKVGDYVTAESHVICNECLMCRTDQKHVCARVTILGVDINGCFAEYTLVPADNLWLVDPALSPETACLLEPIGNAVHTALSGDVTGESTAVFGCGPIGLFSVGVLKAAGARAIFAIDPNEKRLSIAAKMGATHLINPRHEDPVETLRSLSGGYGVDVVLEMSGHPEAIRQGFRALRNGGRAAMLGIPPGPLEIDLGNDVVMKGIRIEGITGRRMFSTWYKTSALLGSGLLDVTPVITHRFKFEEFEQGFQAILSQEAAKVVLLP